MTRSIFGWDLPPGCTMGDIERAAGCEGPCMVCGRSIDDCICPECPDCGSAGDPYCYDEGHRSDFPACEVRLQRNEAQIIGAKLLDEAQREAIWTDSEVRGFVAYHNRRKTRD